jgi:ankyrin repeat protein
VSAFAIQDYFILNQKFTNPVCLISDKNPGNPEATEKFQRIALAYETICADRQFSERTADAFAAEDFLYAAEEGDLDEIRSLMDADVDIFTTDKWGFTALHKAAQRGNWRIVDVLLQHAAAPVLVKMTIKLGGSTALHLAAEKSHYRVIESILQCCSVREFLEMRERHNNRTALEISRARYESSMKYGGDATADQIALNILLRFYEA